MTARRLATIVATVGFVTALVAPFRVFHVFMANTGRGPGALGFWMVEPIALGALAISAVRTQSVAFVWLTVGAVWGFVIAAAWSLGSFFVWEALALLLAGVIHGVALSRRWRLVFAPLWLGAGACALFLILLAARRVL